jgi:hypothetical protein
VAARIESHQGKQDQIQILRGRVDVPLWFENAVLISPEIRRQWRERHPLRSRCGDAGQVGDTTASAQDFKKWPRIELTTDGQVDADTQARFEPAESREEECDSAVRRFAFPLRQSASATPKFPSQSRTSGERHAVAQIEHSLEKIEDVTRLCRCEPLLSTQSNKWGGLRQVRLSARGGHAQC